VLVRDEKTVSLEDAHYKLSYLPAHLGGFKDRGAIREQAPAHIVVCDLDKLEVLPSEVAEGLPAASGGASRNPGVRLGPGQRSNHL
jgi:N-acyl-D-aspartate/D-glutamate deacylase